MSDDIIVRVRAEGVDDFVKQVKTAGGVVENTSKEVEESTDKMSSSFKTLGKNIGAALTVGALIQFSKALYKLAVDVDATEKKFKQVFGESAKVVEDFAKKSATSLGLTVSEYKRAASAAGDLLIPLGIQRAEAAKMSSQLVNLSGALAAWTGGQRSATEVSDILTKALLGEREQLKTLGIQISEADIKTALLEKGQNKLTGSALAQATAFATLELIYKKSTDAQAAFADGTKTLAEQQLEVSASLKTIGEELAQRTIPLWNSLLTLVKQLIVPDELEKLVIDSRTASFQVVQDNKSIVQSNIDRIKVQKQISVAERVELARLKNALQDIVKIEAKRKEDGSFRTGLRGGSGVSVAPEAVIPKVEAAVVSTTKEMEKLRDITFSFYEVLGKIDSELSNNATGIIELESAIKKLLDSDFDIADKIFTPEEVDAANQRIIDGVKDAAEEAKQIRIQKAQEALQEIARIEQQITGTISQVYAGQLAALEEKNRLGLISEKEYQKAKAVILTKEAKTEKATAIFQATLNAALAISGALAKGRPILAAILGALAAAQIAVIAKTPIPKFAKGTKGGRVAPKGFAWVGEQGAELVQMKGGEKVITHGDSEDLMKLLASYSVPVQFKRTHEDLNKPHKTLKDIKSGSKELDFNPLLNASHQGSRYTGRKLDKLHHELVKLNTNMGRKMTAN